MKFDTQTTKCSIFLNYQSQSNYVGRSLRPKMEFHTFLQSRDIPHLSMRIFDVTFNEFSRTHFWFLVQTKSFLARFRTIIFLNKCLPETRIRTPHPTYFRYGTDTVTIRLLKHNTRSDQWWLKSVLSDVFVCHSKLHVQEMSK